MKNNRLSGLLTGINVIKCTGSNNKEITSLIYDSREIIQGSLFFALKGIHTDGHNYINKAIESGAVVIIHSDDLEEYKNDVDYVKVEDCRKAMSPISSAF